MSLRFVFLVLLLSTVSIPALAQDSASDDGSAEDAGAAEGDGAVPAPAPEPEPAPDPAPQEQQQQQQQQQPAPEPTPAPPPRSEPAPAPAPQPNAEPAPVIHPSAQSATPPARATEEEDDGRSADLLWIEVGFGYSWADLAAFESNNFIPGVEQFKGSGYAGHVAAGFKLFIFTLGARGTIGSYPAADQPFDLWSLMFDLGLRIPIFFVEPWFRAGIGYAWMGQVDFTSLGDSDVSVFGLTVEAGAGIDLYFSDYISLGGGIDLAFLNLTRQRLDMCMTVGGAMCDVGGVDLQEDGDAVGFQLRVTGHLALHF